MRAPHFPMTLKNKIFLSMLTVILVISMAIAFLARWILVSGLTSELEMRGVAIARSVAERGGGYILDKEYPQLLALIFDEAQLRERHQLIDYIYVLNSEQKVLAHTFTRRFPEHLAKANPVPRDQRERMRLVPVDGDEAFDIGVPIKEGIYRIGSVHVGLNKGHIDSLVYKLRVTFLGFISAVVVIVFAISHLLAKYITRPIRLLTGAADELSRGNFDVRLEALSGAAIGERLQQCPAYRDTHVPCWHLDRMGSGQPDAWESDRPQCRECIFYRGRFGDEVSQLAAAFRNMVGSIRLYRKRLQESEEKYRSLFASGPDPVFVLAQDDLRILDANPRALETYEYGAEELRGLAFAELAPDQAQKCARDFFEDAPGQGCVYYPKEIHYKKGAHPFFVNAHVCVISYTGRAALIVACTDITEMIEKDAQLIQAAKMKSLGEMSAGIAHELNQPLNAIKMGSDYLVLVAEGGVSPGPERWATVAQEISGQVDRAAGIIATLRAFGRKEALAKDVVDINDPIQAVLSIVRQQFQLHNVDFQLSLGQDLPLVQAQDNRLQQVFFNLFTNAKEAIEDKRRDEPRATGRIEVCTWAAEGRVWARVCDTGPGIPETLRQTLFEPFVSSKTSGQGMGLGLAITHSLVRDYNGWITIASPPDGGACFTVSFPAAAEAVAGTQARSEA